MSFAIHIFSEDQSLLEAFLSCLLHKSPEDQSQITFANKYFTKTIPILKNALSPVPILEKPYAMIFIYTDILNHLIPTFSNLLDNSECNILFIPSENFENLKPFEDLGIEITNESIESFTSFRKENFENLKPFEDLGIEITNESIESFTSFRKEDSEMVGVGRVYEALECAAASFALEEKEKPKKEEKKQGQEVELEKDIDDFEYFLKKIKETSEGSKNADDETRRRNAEDTIHELVKYLRIEDDDDEYND
ncbi:hypothetical protein SteCoe_16760 [Stentor coeruleus]|uniref:Uncharacterized protein n=1 Tax=Stentor coeruleus TaxID=5963 RepID=A0A1R2C0K4_9CILI|nr:hypothetical protein SteCoe_16760 [Stentor coeruleus]